MFEYNGNEEIIETAELPEPMEEIEPITESGLPLNEELNRLYGILEHIDKMMYNISAMGMSLPEEMNGMDAEGVEAIVNAAKTESARLQLLAGHYMNMHTQIVGLIEKIRDDAKPQPKPRSDGFDETAYIVEQINITTDSYRTMCGYLNTRLRKGEIDMDDYRRQMAAVQEECDDRVKRLRGALYAE